MTHPSVARISPRLQLVAACLFITLCWGAPAKGDNAKDVENRIKAAFLYHFCNYVLWPDGTFERPDSPLVLGVIGSGSIAQAIEGAVSRRLANGHPMTVRHISAGDSLDGIHLLFIDASANVRIPDLVERLAGRSVLIVTDNPGGLDAGGVINFVIENDRVRFDIALGTARQRDLHVSAQLLTVAREIRETER